MKDLLYEHYTNLKDQTEKIIATIDNTMSNISAKVSTMEYKERQTVVIATFNNLSKLVGGSSGECHTKNSC